jgi:hypothetical protein
MNSVGFELIFSAGELPQTYALEIPAIGIGNLLVEILKETLIT